MQKSCVVFDRLGVFGFTIIIGYFSWFVYLLANRPETLPQWIFYLNFSGLILEIIGAVVGTYTLREVLVGGGFTRTGFTDSGFTTGTYQIRINKVTASISVVFIIIGLWLQLLGLAFSQIVIIG